jgi:ABC-type cobalamin transport system ATPase subunit
MSRLLQKRTSITIARRLATVQQADVIFVLDGGVIAEQGTHDELLATNGLYARLYHIRFRSPRVAANRSLPADPQSASVSVVKTSVPALATDLSPISAFFR